MIRYLVLCQDSTGHMLEIDVSARTDEQACDAALKVLNSWRSIRAVAANRNEVARGVVEPRRETTALQGADEAKALGEADRGRNHPTEPSMVAGEGEVETSTRVAPGCLTDISRSASPSGPRILYKAGPRDWIDTSVVPRTNVARALMEAAQEDK